MDVQKQMAVISEKLVQLGYASTTVEESGAGMFHLALTKSGQRLKKDLERIVAEVGDRDGIDPAILHLLVGMLVMAEKE